MANTFTLTSSSYDGRYMELTCSQASDISTNKSTISWTLTVAGGNSSHYYTGPTTVIINGETVYSEPNRNFYDFPGSKGSKSGTVEVEHNNLGDKAIAVSFSTAIYWYAISTYSGTWTLDSIPRGATIESAPDFNDEENPTFTYSNPAGNTVSELMACLSFTGERDDIEYRAVSKTGTSYTYQLTDAERAVLR